MRFADATARDAALTAGIPTNGMLVYLTTPNQFTVYSGSAWIPYGIIAQASFPTWTPQIDQGASTNITKTVGLAKYVQFGPLCYFWVDLSLTGAGTASSPVTITLPLTAVGVGASNEFGSCMYYDASQSATQRRGHGSWEFTSTTQISLSVVGNSQSGIWGSDNGLAAASGDIIRGSGVYPVA